jgi:hypothetical protein
VLAFGTTANLGWVLFRDHHRRARDAHLYGRHLLE